jgi:hypothetical protein
VTTFAELVPALGLTPPPPPPPHPATRAAISNAMSHVNGLGTLVSLFIFFTFLIE